MLALNLAIYLLQERNEIRVWNNGDGVPVEIHKDEKVYVPEMIFGHLLTSSNYNDSDKKVSWPVLLHSTYRSIFMHSALMQAFLPCAGIDSTLYVPAAFGNAMLLLAR